MRSSGLIKSMWLDGAIANGVVPKNPKGWVPQ
jgi:hypothetical protein